MARATQFCVNLSNQPGMLAKLCGTFKRAKVNIEAISVADNADCCCVRLIASPTAKAKAALTKGRYNFCTSRVLTLNAPNQPGALEKVAAKLAKARVNINYVYASTAPRSAPATTRGSSATIVLSVSDLNRAAKAIGA